MRCRTWLFLLCVTLFLSGCGFYLQGEKHLAPPLHRMYLQTRDPYGYFARLLEQHLKASHVQLVETPEEADTILAILQDATSQELLSVSGTQQTRQYQLKVTIEFEITNAQGVTIVNPQTLAETRTITVQSNLVLGSSNEANLFYQQMRRGLAYAVMNRIASHEVSAMIMDAFAKPPKP